MARSCFNIISCGCINESADKDKINVSSQNKGSEKPGWGFRKNSARRQEPSNTVVTEKIPSSEYKEVPEPITISSEPKINSNISEKPSDNNIWTEEIPNSITKNVAVSTLATKPVCEADDIKCERVPDESESESESAALVIQAAVRRFLAERRLVKHKNVIKLQAAVRGHLVRNHAVGTLRCVQAIVKMQALVRARREKGVQNVGINSTPTHISIEKLLSNRLARQLLESTPKTKQINIKCDPSKSDSAWNWLERWMSVSSPETLQPDAPDHDQDRVVNNTENEAKMVISSNNAGEATVRFEEKENSVNIEESSNANTHEEEPIPESLVIPENPVSETELKDTAKQVETDQPDSEGRKSVFGSRKASNPAFIAAQSRFEELTSFKTNPLKSPGSPGSPGSGSSSPADIGYSDLLKPANSSNQDDVAGSGSGSSSPADIDYSDPLKPVDSSNQEDDVARSCSGSSSPADIGYSGPLKPVNSSNQEDDVAGSGSGSGSPADIDYSDPLKPASSSNQDGVARSGFGSAADVEPPPRDYLATDGSRVVQNGASECGTELSITSTLDSPDQFEIVNKKPEEANLNIDYDDNNNNNIDIVIPEKHVDQKPDDNHIELEPKPEPEPEPEPIVQLSASESPRTHTTNLESQGTPSSQISTASNKTRTVKKVSGQTRNSWSTSKKSSPVSTSLDSISRISLEQSPKDPKPRKQRNASGSPKPDRADQEPVVPGYMQATESARAKAVANSSPRSSPDVHDKETYLKKRHSLPGVVNGRHGSPRIQRSMSQALQTTKGNGNQERKWQR